MFRDIDAFEAKWSPKYFWARDVAAALREGVHLFEAFNPENFNPHQIPSCESLWELTSYPLTQDQIIDRGLLKRLAVGK